MTIAIRPYTEGDLPAMLAIWNQVVEEGVAFPQDEPLDEETGRAFARQTHTAVAEDTDHRRPCRVVYPASLTMWGGAGISATPATR